MQETISGADLGILIRGGQTYPWLKLSSLGNNLPFFLSFICFTVKPHLEVNLSITVIKRRNTIQYNTNFIVNFPWGLFRDKY